MIDALEATIVILAFIVALKFSSRKFTPQSLISDKLEILFADIACYSFFVVFLAVAIPMIIIFLGELGTRHDGLIEGDN